MSFSRISTSLLDCFLIEPQVFGDDRGFFMETYSEIGFRNIGISVDFVQDNHSKSKRWVFRGLHFQTRKPQAKLVRVTSGSVYDIVVDLRKDSPSFGKWEGFLLSAENKRMLFIPRGFAHGFLTLEEGTECQYKCDDFYDPEYESWIIWNDPILSINWNDQFFWAFELNKKDLMQPSFQAYLDHPLF